MSSFNIGKYSAEIIKPSSTMPKRIENFLKKIDKNFYEPLSTRVNLKDYSEKLAEKATNIFLMLSLNDVAHTAIYNLDNQSKIFVSNFGVVSRHQGKGIGNLLYKLVQNYATDSKFLSIELEADYRDANLIKFYKQRGFKKMSDYLLKRNLLLKTL